MQVASALSDQNIDGMRPVNSHGSKIFNMFLLTNRDNLSRISINYKCKAHIAQFAVVIMIKYLFFIFVRLYILGTVIITPMDQFSQP